MFNRVQNWLFHEDRKRRHMPALALLVGSGLGLLASLALSIESLVLAKNSEAVLSCDLNSALSCSAVANHWSAAIFGFPNSFTGDDYHRRCPVGGDKVSEMVYAMRAGWRNCGATLCFLDVWYELFGDWRTVPVVLDS